MPLLLALQRNFPRPDINVYELFFAALGESSPFKQGLLSQTTGKVEMVPDDDQIIHPSGTQNSDMLRAAAQLADGPQKNASFRNIWWPGGLDSMEFYM